MAKRSDVDGVSSSTNRSDLLRLLDTIKPALGKVVFVPVLGHFCFDGKWVSAYNDSVGIACTVDIGITGALPGDLTLRLLNSMAADGLSITMSDAGTAVVKCGRSNVKLPTMPPDAFVFKPAQFKRPQVEFKITENALIGIEMCLIAVGVDPTHAAQMGVTVDPASACLYSTDNVTMSRYRFKKGDPIIDAAQDGQAFILPTAFCQQLVSMAKRAGDVEIVGEVHESGIVVRFGEDVLLFGKVRSDTTPLDFAGVFSKTTSGDAVGPIDVPALWGPTLERASAVVDPQHPVTSMECEEGVLHVETKSQLGEMKDEVDLGDDALEFKKFLVDPSHLVRAGKVCDSISFGSAAVIMQVGAFTHLVSHCRD